MNESEMQALMANIAPIIKQFVAQAINPVAAKVDALESKVASVNIGSALIDREGNLVWTAAGGAQFNLGKVVGTNGEEGKAGKDGTDGFSLKDFTLEYDGQRKITFKFIGQDGEKAYSIVPPWPLYRGVYHKGQEYVAGDSVTWAGSLWIALEPTSSQPGSGDGWQLSTKRGRDGKEVVRVNGG